MDRIDAMQAFVRVVETGSFTRAADTLQTSRTRVTQLVQQLEAHLREALGLEFVEREPTLERRAVSVPSPQSRPSPSRSPQRGCRWGRPLRSAQPPAAPRRVSTSLNEPNSGGAAARRNHPDVGSAVVATGPPVGPATSGWAVTLAPASVATNDPAAKSHQCGPVS